MVKLGARLLWPNCHGLKRKVSPHVAGPPSHHICTLECWDEWGAKCWGYESDYRSNRAGTDRDAYRHGRDAERGLCHRRGVKLKPANRLFYRSSLSVFKC